MSATSEPQVPKLDSRELLSLLQQQVAGGEPCPHSFIYKEDAYSAPPADLVRGHEHAPGTDQDDGKGRNCYFFSPARYHDSAGAGSTQRRQRTVPGGGIWRTEAGKIAVRDAGGHTVGYKRTLYYISKTKNSSGVASYKRLGWCMKEFCLNLLDGADQLVLCVVYKSPRTGPETFTEASSSAVEDPGQADTSGLSEGGAILNESLDVPVPDGDIPSPVLPPASCDYNLHSPGPWVALEPALSIVPFPNHQTLCRPGGEILSSTNRVAIVKKVNAAPVAAEARDGEKAAAARIVMKFGRSSIPSAERMKEMAKLILSYPAESGQIVAVVLSEIGNTTNNIFLAIRKALTCTDQKVSEIHEFGIIKQLYFRTIDELGLDRSIVSGPLNELEHHLRHIAMTKELTTRTRDYHLFFGERTSTKMFFEHLNELGKGTLLEWELCDVTTMGRSGSYLTAITIGRALGSTEIQAWKDVDGVFTCDPKIYEKATLVPYLTFDEGAELMLFCEQSRQLAMEGAISVIVKNSCNPQALGTLIAKTRYMSEITLTSIVLKSNITMMDIEMKSMLDQDAFVAKVLPNFKDLKALGMSVDCLVTSEGKMSFVLVPSKLLSQESIQLELDNVVEELKKIAAVDLLQHRSVISLIGNALMPAYILEMALCVVRGINVEVQKFSQGSSKVNKVSLFVNDTEGQDCVKALHDAFFGELFAPIPKLPIQENPIPEIPIQVNPVQEIPILETPIQENPIPEIPIPVNPVPAIPILETPIQENPIQEIPIQVNPVPEIPTPDSPIQENPIPESPILENPIPENSSVAASSGFKRKAEALEPVNFAFFPEDIARDPNGAVYQFPKLDVSDFAVDDLSNFTFEFPGLDMADFLDLDAEGNGMGGLDLPSIDSLGGSKRLPRYTPNAWGGFTKIYTKDPQVVYAPCNHCGRMIKLKGGSISSLLKHSENCHKPHQLREATSEQSELV